MAMTPEERKARDAQRKRDSRAKARAERDAVAAGKKAQAEVDAPRTMRDGHAVYRFDIHMQGEQETVFFEV